MKNCKECIHSMMIYSRNLECIPEAICTLSNEEFHDCLSNDKSRFEGNQLYLMCRSKKGGTENEVN